MNHNLAKNPLRSIPGEILVVLLILMPNSHQACCTIHQRPKSGELSIQTDISEIHQNIIKILKNLDQPKNVCELFVPTSSNL